MNRNCVELVMPPGQIAHQKTLPLPEMKSKFFGEWCAYHCNTLCQEREGCDNCALKE